MQSNISLLVAEEKLNNIKYATTTKKSRKLIGKEDWRTYTVNRNIPKGCCISRYINNYYCEWSKYTNEKKGIVR